MSKPHTIKSSMLAASLPIVLKSILVHGSFLILIIIFYMFIKTTNLFEPWFIVFLFLPIFTFLFSLIKLDFIFLPIYFTRYTFYENHIEKKYKFINEVSKTIPYSHIVNVMLEKTILDRILNTGTLLIYTGNDSFISGTRTISMKIYGIFEPAKIRNLILSKAKNNF